MDAKRKGYSPSCRRDSARLVIDTGCMIVQVAREIGVGEQGLGRWAATERARMDDPPGAFDVDERAELERLCVENAQLRMNREFLKIAAVFFVMENAVPSPSGRSSWSRRRRPPSASWVCVRCWVCPGRGTTRSGPMTAGRP